MKNTNLSKLHIAKAHDHFFKTAMTDKRVAKEFFEAHLPHQSQPDELMAFRVLKYICNIINQHLKSKETNKIPFILPMVVYHGDQVWKYSTDINDLVDAPRHFIDAYFLKPFMLIDLNKIDDEIIKKNTWLSVMELTLKHIFKPDMLPYLPDIVKILKYVERENGNNLVETVLVYVFDRGELNRKDFISLIKREFSSDIGEK